MGCRWCASAPGLNAVTVFEERALHSLPIVDDEGTLVGIVTTTDIMRYLLDQY